MASKIALPKKPFDRGAKEFGHNSPAFKIQRGQKVELTIKGDSVSPCGRYKYYRFQIKKPTCLTLPDIGDDDVYEVWQLFGPPTCMKRKKTGIEITAECCQIVMLKPGHYELALSDAGLFPINWEIFEREMTMEEAQLLIANQSEVLCL
jgi:hypothetical protein